jgi:hypothetical protein
MADDAAAKEPLSANVLRYSLQTGPPVHVATSLYYSQTNVSFVATGATTVVSFLFQTQHAPGFWPVDDVSLTPRAAAVPGPMVGAGVPGLLLATRIGKRARPAVHSVQLSIYRLDFCPISLSHARASWDT